MSDIKLTEKENKAITALKKVAKIWPDTLWLYSAEGSLCVMRKGVDGEFVRHSFSGGVDSSYVIETIEGIDNDGGGW